MSNFPNKPLIAMAYGIFDRTAKAFLYSAENYCGQPSLEAPTGVSGLSPFYFQREFTRLACVSRKNFVAHLTLERAKRSLIEGRTVLDAAFEAGLSGSSRLHDLVLKAEAMTPGSYARRGAGVTIFYGWHPTLFGRALLAATTQGLC